MTEATTNKTLLKTLHAFSVDCSESEFGMLLEQPSEFGWAPVHSAILTGNLPSLEFLLRNAPSGARRLVEPPLHDKKTLLQWAEYIEQRAVEDVFMYTKQQIVDFIRSVMAANYDMSRVPPVQHHREGEAGSTIYEPRECYNSLVGFHTIFLTMHVFFCRSVTCNGE